MPETGLPVFWPPTHDAFPHPQGALTDTLTAVTIIQVLAATGFIIATAFVLYTLVGYPILLAWLSRHPRTIRRRYQEVPVTVLLPVRNGEDWITAKLESLLALNYPAELLQILVLSDGSSDRTVELARKYASPNLEVFELQRGGKCQALNFGMNHARGEVLFLTDVRQPLDSDALRHLLACLGDPEVGAVSGELIILEGNTKEQVSVGLYWKYEKWFRKRLSNLDSFHGATGAIYAIRRSLARPLPPDALLDDVYLPLCAFFSGYRVVFEERAIAYDYPVSLKSEFGRKVRTQAGVYQLLRYFPALLGPKNRMWIHFMSHKVARLLLPWALFVILVSSLALPSPWRTAILIPQVGFILLALLDLVLTDSNPLKRLTSPTRTFMAMMAAAALGITIFFRESHSLWKPQGTRQR